MTMTTSGHSGTDYDDGGIAEQYREAKTQAWRSRVEAFSFLNLIGDVRGKRVLDIACGEGYFTRLLRRAGAAEVIGCDISERMIELARKQEDAAPLGITYRVGDARTVATRAEFDLVVSAWLLVYARSRDELALYCRGVASQLAPGGRFVTVLTNPDVYAFRPDYRKYGFEVRLRDRADEGAPIDIALFSGGGELVITNYYLPVGAYTCALEAAGFQDVAVHRPELAPAPDGVDDSAHWEYILRYPFFILLDATKT